jgi:hypothetical protein
LPFIQASEQPAQRKPVPLVDMTGGIDYSTAAFQVDQKYWLDALNVDPLAGGGAAMRRAIAPVHTGNFTDRPRTLSLFDQGNGIPQLVVSFDSGEIRYVTRVEDENGPSSQILGSGSGRPWRGVQSGKFLYLQDGVNPAKRWNGSTLTTLGTAYNNHTWSPAATYRHNNMPIARLLSAGHNRIWAVISSDKLAWSYPLTLEGGAEDWGDEDFVICEPGVGGPEITAIIWANDRLFVFKEHATFQVLGWSPGTFQLFAVSTKHGASGPEAVATDGTRVFAYDTQCGLHVIAPTQGGGMASDEGQAFRPMSKLLSDKRISETGSKEFTVGHVNDHVYVSVILDGQRQVLAIDLNLAAWSRYDLQLGDYAYFHVGGRSTPVACSWNGARPWQIVELDIDADEDRSGFSTHQINSWFKTAWVHDGSPTMAKRWAYTDFILDAGFGQSIVPFVSYDWDAGNTVSLGVVVAEESLADPFIMPTSRMVEADQEYLTPDSAPTSRPWPNASGADEMQAGGPKTTRRRARFPALEATAISFLIYGPVPSKRWSVRMIVPTYSPSRRAL